MNRLLLVDGSNLLFQMFYGMPARITNRQGKAIHATLGFTGALLKIIRQAVPTHMAVFFDGEHENDRSRIDPDYKTNRIDYSEVPEEENPFSQLDDVYAALDFLGIRHAETTVCETDDLIAGYALTLEGETEIVISSWDSDFFQLITDQTSVRAAILQNRQRLETNYRLIKLEHTAPLPFALPELAYSDTGLTTNEVLKGIGLK